jgi:hypothetical protein
MRIFDDRSLDIRSSIEFVQDTLGIVVGDRDDTGEDSFKIFVPRFMGAIDIEDGLAREEEFDLGSVKVVNNVNKDIGGSNVKEQNYIKMRPYLVNGISCPYLVKGERVRVTFADKDIKSPTFFPLYNHNDANKRLTDDIRLWVPSKLSIDDPNDNEHTYYLRLDSRGKKVHLHTSMEQNENNIFDILIDTEKGEIKITDGPDSKRVWLWSFNEDKFYCETDGGTKQTIQDNHVKIETEDYELLASNSIHMKTTNYKLEAENGDNIVTNESHENTSYKEKSTTHSEETTTHKVKSTSYYNNATSGAYDIKTLQIKAPAFIIDCPLLLLNGLIYFSGMQFGPPVPCPLPPPPPDPPKAGSGGGSNASSPAAPATPMPAAPKSKRDGGGGMVDVVDGNAGQPLAFSAPTISALTILAAAIDANALALIGHIHGPPGLPIATASVSSVLPNITAPRIKA